MSTRRALAPIVIAARSRSRRDSPGKVSRLTFRHELLILAAH
jgi:hypothetical protein